MSSRTLGQTHGHREGLAIVSLYASLVFVSWPNAEPFLKSRSNVWGMDHNSKQQHADDADREGQLHVQLMGITVNWKGKLAVVAVSSEKVKNTTYTNCLSHCITLSLVGHMLIPIRWMSNIFYDLLKPSCCGIFPNWLGAEIEWIVGHFTVSKFMRTQRSCDDFPSGREQTAHTWIYNFAS